MQPEKIWAIVDEEYYWKAAFQELLFKNYLTLRISQNTRITKN